MPVVDADEFFLYLFFGFENGHKIVQKIEKTKFIQIHCNAYIGNGQKRA